MAALRAEVEEAVEAKRSGVSPDDYVAEFTSDDIHKLPLVGTLVFLLDIY